MSEITMSGHDSKLIAEALTRMANTHEQNIARLVKQESNSEHLTNTVRTMSESTNKAITKLADTVGELTTEMRVMTKQLTHVEERITDDYNDVKERIEILDEKVKTRTNELCIQLKGNTTRIDESIGVLKEKVNVLELSEAAHSGYSNGKSTYSTWFANNWFQLIGLISLIVGGATAISKIPKEMPLPPPPHSTMIERVIIPSQPAQHEAVQTTE